MSKLYLWEALDVGWLCWSYLVGRTETEVDGCVNEGGALGRCLARLRGGALCVQQSKWNVLFQSRYTITLGNTKSNTCSLPFAG